MLYRCVFFFSFLPGLFWNFYHLFDMAPPTIPSTKQGDVINCSKELKDITWPRGDTKLLFECWKIFDEWGQRYFTIERSSLVKYFLTLEEKFRVSARPSISTFLLQLIIHLNCLSPRPLKILFFKSHWVLQSPQEKLSEIPAAGWTRPPPTRDL